MYSGFKWLKIGSVEEAHTSSSCHLLTLNSHVKEKAICLYGKIYQRPSMEGMGWD